MSDGAAEERGLHTHVGSMFDGVVCADAEELARAYGAAVFDPTRWPEETGARHYVLAAPPPSPPFPELPASYRIFSTPPDGSRTPVVLGRSEPPSHTTEHGSWFAVEELADLEGMAQVRGDQVELILRSDGQTVHLCFFTSVAEAVATARSLRKVEPRA